MEPTSQTGATQNGSMGLTATRLSFDAATSPYLPPILSEAYRLAEGMTVFDRFELIARTHDDLNRDFLAAGGVASTPMEYLDIQACAHGVERILQRKLAEQRQYHEKGGNKRWGKFAELRDAAIARFQDERARHPDWTTKTGKDKAAKAQSYLVTGLLKDFPQHFTSPDRENPEGVGLLRYESFERTLAGWLRRAEAQRAKH